MKTISNSNLTSKYLSKENFRRAKKKRENFNTRLLIPLSVRFIKIHYR